MEDYSYNNNLLYTLGCLRWSQCDFNSPYLRILAKGKECDFNSPYLEVLAKGKENIAQGYYKDMF